MARQILQSIQKAFIIIGCNRQKLDRYPDIVEADNPFPHGFSGHFIPHVHACVSVSLTFLDMFQRFNNLYGLFFGQPIDIAFMVVFTQKIMQVFLVPLHLMGQILDKKLLF